MIYNYIMIKKLGEAVRNFGNELKKSAEEDNARIDRNINRQSNRREKRLTQTEQNRQQVYDRLAGK